MPEAGEERAREGLRGVLGLFRDVDGVLEADQRVERDRRAGDHQQRGRGVVVELERGARIAAAVEQERGADHHHEEQAADLDQRAHDVEAGRLLDAAEVDRGHDGDHRQPDEDLRQLDELAQVVAAEGGRQRGRGRQARAHHREGDDEREQVALERLVDVQRGAGGLRVLAHQLGVGGGGERRDDRRDQEAGPDRPADLARDLACPGVDAAAQDVADDEQQQGLLGDPGSE